MKITESYPDIASFLKGVPGIYPGIPAAQYHGLKAISSSVLKRLYTHSPKHAKAVMDNPDLADSEALDIGAAAHCLTLTPDLFDAEFIVGEKCAATVASGERKGQPCSNDGKKFIAGAWYCGSHSKNQECEYAASGKTILDVDAHRRVKGIHAALWENENARTILEAATDFELSVLWVDEKTGLLCKARFDILCREIGIIPDLKTCRSLKTFNDDSYRAAYHLQLCFYSRGAIVQQIGADIPAIIAVENDEPHDTATPQVHQELMDEGFAKLDLGMATIAQCIETNVWPGYGSQLKWLLQPAWAKN